jgi:hypothetical protein
MVHLQIDVAPPAYVGAYDTELTPSIFGYVVTCRAWLTRPGEAAL